MNINKKKLSLTFKKIKGEIDEVKKSLNSFTITNDSKIKTINQKFNLSLDETIILFKKRLDLSINEINDSLQEIYDTTSKSKVIDKKIAQIQHKLDKHSLNIKEFTKIIKNNDKNLILLNSKLQEFENMSVDIEDVENNFISRSEVNKKIKKVGNVKKIENRIEKLISKNEKFSDRIKNLEENNSMFVSMTKFNTLTEDFIELKSNTIIKKDLIQMNERIDQIEEEFYNKIELVLKNFKKIESNLENVLVLKKEFVTKEQFKNLRKEIKMLVQGLKDVQKIKTKISKIDNKKDKKQVNTKAKNNNTNKRNSIFNFFFEE
ncbi:hypothetical protein HN415_01665 [Candidatus Woesearchaeota archaeon]|jgi:hypothetical protein|nr:hypothetical protein [Candidatus Woesearchaeota archaeon]